MKKCKKCKKSIENKTTRCWDCWSKFRTVDAKWLIKYCKDCGVQLKSRVAKRCKPCNGKLTSKLRKGIPLSPLRRQKQRKIMSKLRKNPEFNRKRKLGMKKGKSHHNYKHGKSSKPNYCIDCSKNVNWRSIRCKSCSNRINTKKYWQDENYREKVIMNTLKSSHIKPNKPEKLLNRLLNKLVPNEYKINVKGQVMILGSKIPDFINVNGQKKIIEMFGDYWHSDEFIKRRGCYEDTEVGRIKYFRKLGWKTLIIWEHELKDLSKVKERILKFNKK